MASPSGMRTGRLARGVRVKMMVSRAVSAAARRSPAIFRLDI